MKFTESLANNLTFFCAITFHLCYFQERLLKMLLQLKNLDELIAHLYSFKKIIIINATAAQQEKLQLVSLAVFMILKVLNL